VNKRAKIMVAASACRVIVRFSAIKAWWANVIVAPEDKRRHVFNKGTWNGEKASIAAGGQIHPKTCVGAKEEWKNAQKKSKKKKNFWYYE